MGEVDRLSTSGTYPALPMTGKRRAREESRDAGSGERRADDERTAGAPAAPGPASPSTSLIDEYA